MPNKKHTKKNKVAKTKMPSAELPVPNYTKNVSEPWFSLIQLGLKTVEGRLDKGDFHNMKPGDIVEWTNDDFLHRRVFTRITRKNNYKTFAEYLTAEGLDHCLPGMEKYGMPHGLAVYYKYFTKADESAYGITAIHLEVIATSV